MLFVLFMLTLILVFLYVWSIVLDGFKFKDLGELYNWNLYRYMQSIDLFFKKDVEFAHFYRKTVRPALIKRRRRKALEDILSEINTAYIEAIIKGRESFLFSYDTDMFSQEEVIDIVIKNVNCGRDRVSFHYKRIILGVELETCTVLC